MVNDALGENGLQNGFLKTLHPERFSNVQVRFGNFSNFVEIYPVVVIQNSFKKLLSENLFRVYRVFIP